MLTHMDAHNILILSPVQTWGQCKLMLIETSFVICKVHIEGTYWLFEFCNTLNADFMRFVTAFKILLPRCCEERNQKQENNATKMYMLKSGSNLPCFNIHVLFDWTVSPPCFHILTVCSSGSCVKEVSLQWFHLLPTVVASMAHTTFSSIIHLPTPINHLCAISVIVCTTINLVCASYVICVHTMFPIL